MATYLKNGAWCNMEAPLDDREDLKFDQIINIYSTQPGKRKHNN